MSDKPRKPRITTEATKAKLPKPKRKRPPNSAPKRETWAEGYAKWEAKAERAKSVQWLVLAGPHDIHTCSDAKALREAEARAVPCGEDVIGLTFDGDDGRTYTIQKQGIGVKWTPAKPLDPWSVRVLNWLDDAPKKARRWLARTLSALATWLKRLAYKVAP